MSYSQKEIQRNGRMKVVSFQKSHPEELQLCSIQLNQVPQRPWKNSHCHCWNLHSTRVAEPLFPCKACPNLSSWWASSFVDPQSRGPWCWFCHQIFIAPQRSTSSGQPGLNWFHLCKETKHKLALLFQAPERYKCLPQHQVHHINQNHKIWLCFHLPF